MGKILRVDLSRMKIKEEALEHGLLERFIGGKGLGAWILYKELRPGIEPLGPENKIVLATGPLTGTMAPMCAGKYVIVTKSPLTGIFNDTYSGGFFGPRLKFAGYDVIVINGRSDKPVYLLINDGQTEIRDATHLWGKTTHETEKIIKEEVGDGKTSVASIGPAGENMVRFACITNDFGRQAGRGGAGAVFGSKNLKAIAVRGEKKVEIAKPHEFDEAVKEIREVIKKSPGLEWGPTFGTPAFVSVAQAMGGWPVKDWDTGYFEFTECISGELLKEKFVVRNSACYMCPIGCGKIVEIKEGPYAGTLLEGPEYESIASLGANCMIRNLEAIAYANLLCDQYGMDTISTGVVIGFAMDLYERGIVSKEDTNGMELRFGDEKALIETIKNIAYRKGFGNILAEGTRKASEIIGRGASYYDVSVKGLELPAWDPRAFWGHALSYAISDRGGCHLHAGALGAELAGKVDRFTIDGKAKIVWQTETEMAAADTLIYCLFAIYAPVTLEHYVKLLTSATGMEIDERKFLLVGERILNLTRAFNVREGITRKDDSLPKRLMEKGHTSGPSKDKFLTKDALNKMLDEYYELREWDKKKGVPTRQKLEELELKDVADELSELGKLPI